MKARCKCTLEDKGDGSWVKPMDGYLEPDPDCPDCKGEGFNVALFPEKEEISAVYHAICRTCKSSVGFHIELKGDTDTKEFLEDSNCVCPECEEHCNWEKSEEKQI